jgi:hypothetical protein
MEQFYYILNMYKDIPYRINHVSYTYQQHPLHTIPLWFAAMHDTKKLSIYLIYLSLFITDHFILTYIL